MERLGADFIAMPGHKGLMGPQGTGLLLCAGSAEPLLRGGTGSDSENQDMTQYLPDRLEAGTLNVPGIAGLGAALRHLKTVGMNQRESRERAAAAHCAGALQEMGFRVFSGADQTGTVSFVPRMDCEEAARHLAGQGVAVRAGLHCAPLAHESAGTLETGTVRVSFGADAHPCQTDGLIKAIQLSKIH
jgi:selenocysteine lyase/cysteine desulfurase